ncbi:MAG: hypothetical protein NDJ90_00440, partial [Oligoflexia bacterium]|nr:hypothetical protein [Oligoflexia bacterium]
ALGETPEGREAALKAAEILAGYKEAHKDAIKRARKIIDRWPRSIQAVTAARLWVQLLSDRLPSSSSDAAQVSSGALDDLRDAMKELRENAALLAADQELGKGKLKAQLGDQEFRLKIVSIAVHEKDKDHGAAAQGYEAFAKDATQRELAEKAYASALANYLKASDEEGRERVAAAWLQRYPRSPKAIESLRLVATQELIQGHFEKAARLFEKLGGEGGDADSLETAARIHEGIGDQARAIAAWRRYLATYKTAHVPAIRLQLARALDLSQQDSEAAKAYRDCMSVPELAAECGARLADLHLRARNAAEAKALFKKVGASAGAAARSPWVAYSRYMLASFQEQEARFAPLELPEAQLKKAMNQRLAFLEQLSRAYGSAVEAGGPWAIAALDRLAGWVMGFAEEVERIAAPPGAAPAAVAQFRKTLAGVSGPLRKKAVQTWQEAYTKCIAAEAMSPALPEIADRLADSGIAGVGRAQGVHGLYRLAGVPADGGPEGSSAALEKTRAKLVKNPQDSVAWLDYGNLLWGQGKPLLSSLAYDRAEALNRRSPAAINNRAVVELSLAKGTSEDWLVAATASERFRGASKLDEFFLPAKFNRASLLNYYRLFPKAKPLWEQVLAKGAGADAQDGMAIALQGTGDLRRAEAAFQRASELGSPDSRFAAVYHEAARLAATSPAQCLSRIEDGDSATLTGFEKNAFERLKRACTSWNMQGKTTTQP